MGCQPNDNPSPPQLATDGANDVAPSVPVERSASASIPPPAALPAALPAVSHPYIGGNWTSCADGFHPSNQPQRDVTRLALVCGPYQGMRRQGRTWFGNVSPSKEGHVDFRVSEGQCLRVFAVAHDNLRAGSVDVFGPDAVRVGHGSIREGFAIANEDGAICVDRTGDYRVRISALQGEGMAAVEVWTLPAP